MSEQLQKEILEELKQLNAKVDRLSEQTNKEKDLPSPKIIIALIAGVILGPIVLMLLSALW